MTSIRPFDLRDLRTLYRLRSEVISLDAVRYLTRGNPLGAIGVMAYMNPQRHLYAAVCQDDSATLVGGIIHTNGDSFAKLLYLAPASQVDHPGTPELLERLAVEAGTWGAFHVVADLDEHSPAFVSLRQAGFSVYAWQRIWDISHLDGSKRGSRWKRATSVNLPAIQSLHHQIVPPLLQAIEPTPRRASGSFCGDGPGCYVSVSSGLMGIVLSPLIHPETTEVPARLLSLIQHLPNRGGRPVYLLMRSYETWLESVLSDLGAEPCERQAVLVKHLTRLVKEEQPVRAAQPATVGVPASHVSRMAQKKKSL